MEFIHLLAPQGTENPCCLQLRSDGVVCHESGITRMIRPEEVEGAVFVGSVDGEDCYAVQAGEEAILTPIRSLLAELAPETFSLLAAGKALLHWAGRSRYCGACGGRTEKKLGERSVVCSRCGEIFYPQIAPVVMVAVVNEEGRLLLARNASFRGERQSVIAGFVEAGESLEDAAVREVAEEVGLRIRELRYQESQFWPFPGSLIAAFIAQHAGGEIRCDGVEIVEAGWYSVDDHPPLPSPGSISRCLIDAVLNPQ